MTEQVVVDAHTHLLPGRLAERVRVHFGAAASRLVYPLDHGEIRALLAADGVDEIWTLPYAHKPGVADWLNESARDVASTEGGVRVVGGATVHPADDRPVEIVERAIDVLGLRVLKLHCSVGQFSLDDPRLDPIWPLLIDRGVPVVVHVGHAPSGMTTADELAPVANVAARYPDAAIVIAHAAHPAVDAAADLVVDHANVYIDLTPVVASPPVIAPERLAELSHRVLFGSDTPNVAIRAGERIDAIRSLDLEPAAIEAILGGNASRLVNSTRP